MTRAPCAHLIPQYGWRDDHRGRAVDKMMREDREVLLGHTCGWADHNPELLMDMPQWMQAELLNAPGYRDRFCDGCRCYKPASTVLIKAL